MVVCMMRGQGCSCSPRYRDSRTPRPGTCPDVVPLGTPPSAGGCCRATAPGRQVASRSRGLFPPSPRESRSRCSRKPPMDGCDRAAPSPRCRAATIRRNCGRSRTSTLLRLPRIESFVQHQNPQPVAGIQKRRRGRIVRRSHRVESGRLQQLYSALLGAVECRRSQRSVVVVDAAAREFDRLAVQQKPLLRRPRKRSNAEGRFHLIQQLPFFSTRVTARYRTGESGDHSAGLATAISWVGFPSLPAAPTSAPIAHCRPRFPA